MFAYAAEGIHR